MPDCESPSLSRYKDRRIRCRCEGCKAANRTYMQRYRRQRDLNRSGRLVDVTPARRLIIELRKDGVTYREILERAGDGISLMQVYRIANGYTCHVQPAVARRLISVCGQP